MNDEQIQENLRKYQFYHVIRLKDGIYTPGFQQYVQGQEVVLRSLRSLDLRGKRVLDIGCRDGLFCFEAEKMGASEIIGIDNDLSVAATEFLIPYFNSKVKMVELNVYDLLPETFGKFDVVIFAGVLYHLRYPFWALRRVREILADGGQLIIETAILDAWHNHALVYCPIGSESPYEPTSVTFFNTKGLIDTLYSLGISVRSVDSGKASDFKWQLSRLVTRLRKRMPVKRATLTCELTFEPVNRFNTSYWNNTHKFHSTGGVDG